MAADDLWQRTLKRTQQALACGALQSIPTDYQYVEDGGIRFLVRVVANLERKAAARRPVDPFALPGSPKANPFLPYEQELFVSNLSDSHVCLLNKFNVVEHHLLVVTRAFEPQEALLSLADFEALWLCLEQVNGLGFYNAGEIAGASQRHKHLQLVPLPLAPNGPAVPIQPALDGALPNGATSTCPALPFAHAYVRPPWQAVPYRDRAEATLGAYLDLLRTVGLVPNTSPLPRSAAAPYNLLVTRDWMLLVPRSQEHVERVSINALGFAGALLVRTPEDLARLKSVGPLSLLRRA